MRVSSLPINWKAPRRNLLRTREGPTEFEIQSHLYESLKRLGYIVRGEVGCRRGKSRFDIAIYPTVDDPPIRIVEVKRNSPKAKCGRKSQADAYYADYGVPVDVVCGMKEANEYIAAIATIILSS